jgi:LCP family protein required for cell wall assembly
MSMPATEMPGRRTAVYHVTSGQLAPTPSLRGCLLQLAATAAAFFALLIVAVILVALSPTLSRSVTAFFVRPQAGSIPWNGSDPVNIVIAGLDQRANQPHEFPHTDTLMVASINPQNDSIRILSIPRDLWVTIPGVGPDRVNDAYGDGGTKLLAQTVEGITNMPIRYYAIIKFTSFEKVIDALGGVTIDVKHTIYDPTYPAFVGNGYAPLYIPAGVHHMNGKLALEYVRTRHDDPLGDLGRNQRQQQLLLALKQQALRPGTLLRLPILIDSLGKAIDTNFPYSSVPYLARIMMTVPKSHIERAELNYANNAVSNYTTSAGAEVLLPNWPKIHQIAHQLFADPRLATAAVDVLNGSGIPGQAAALSQWMAQCGFTIGTVGDANSTDYEHTLVIRNSAVPGSDYVARMAADLLQTHVTTRPVPGSHAPVVIIIGHDWNDPAQS